LFNLFMTTLAAYPLSRPNLKYRGFFSAIFVFTMMFNAGLIPNYLLMQKLHLVNNPLVLIIPGAITITNMIIMRTFFSTTIPEELHEAAIIDGAGNLRTLVSVVLPLSKSVYAVMALYYGVAHWNSYFNAMIYLANRSLFPLQVFLREILTQNQVNNMSQDSGITLDHLLIGETLKYCIIVFASLPILIIYPFLQKNLIKGVMIGAVKG